jgi:endonuclease YncB( thermonuclease family)
MPLKPEYSAALRRRKLLRLAVLLILFVLGLTILLDHLGAFGYRGDDWASFDGRRFEAQRIAPNGFVIISNHLETEVRFLGLDFPERHAANSRGYLVSSLAGKMVILKLDPLQTRDAAGHLLAYVYLTEADCLNADIVRAGHARADRRQKHSMQAVFDAAETDARKHGRGMWKDASKNER